MATLLLRLAGPMQSWGDESKFEYRRTLRFPTKSGVVGMLAAALGRLRDDPVDDLAALKFGVRADKEGELLEDYHIARPANSKDPPYVTHRYYICDAVFLVGFESDDIQFLKTLEKAIKTPAFPLYLGRRSCPPTLPIVIGIRNLNLEDALYAEPWLCKSEDSNARVITDSTDSGAVLHDVPVSYSKTHRQYGWRYVKDDVINKADVIANTDHDALSELR